jgi:hypothetical protein
VEYTIDPSVLIPDTLYTITLKVAKGPRTKSASVKINVVTGNPPTVSDNCLN